MNARNILATASRGAVISGCGQFRYYLTRHWSSAPGLVFVMLNPSTADADVDDATIRRCAGFAVAEGFGGIEVVNLFAYRATDPKDLKSAGYQVGPGNDRWIELAAISARDGGGALCVAWGANAAGLGRPQAVLTLLAKTGVAIQCLRVTRGGHPQHPLMLSSSCRLQPFNHETAQAAIGATA